MFNPVSLLPPVFLTYHDVNLPMLNLSTWLVDTWLL